MTTRKRVGTALPILNAAGVSANTVRSFILQAAELPSWDANYAQKMLGVDGATAKGVLSALAIIGYIEPHPQHSQAWRTTAAGNAVAGVSRAKPITRETADRALREVLNRIKQVNLKPGYLFSVEKAVVFGPYLTSADRIQNVDIAIELQPKIADPRALEQRVAADANKAEAAGKRFKSFADRRNWGRNKVRQFLQGRSRAVALYDLNDTIMRQPHRIVFER